jgi:glycosyltransferase involved in cell wall biosynthesis
MKQYYEYPDLRKKHGEAGRKRVFDLFDCNVVSGAWVKFYEELL